MTEKQYHTGALELMPLTEKLVADTRTYESTASYDAGNRITNWNRAGAPVNNAQSWNYDDNGNWISTTKTALIWWGSSEKHRRLVGVLDRMSGASEARRVKAREASLNQCAEHKHQAGQNDIMAHPSRLNSVIARAVDGSKFKLEWYHKNYLDHVYAVTDDSGDILEHYRYTAFGEVSIYNSNGNQVSTTQIDNHILWNTRRRDELTGYYLYKFRHYSPELGRWPSRDPIEEEGGVNLYAFGPNNPINGYDVLGLKICTKQRIDKTLVNKSIKLGRIKGKFKIQVRGTFKICDDGEKELTAEVVGAVSGEFPLPIAILTGIWSVEAHGKLNAKWCDGFQGGSAEAEVIVWAGVKLDGGVAEISGEIGGSASWDISVDGDEHSLDLEAKGNDVYMNGRVKIKLEIGWFDYTKEIFRVSGAVGKAPDWSASIDLPSTVL